MIQHGLLHPIEVTRIVDVPHEIDVMGLDRDREVMGKGAAHTLVSKPEAMDSLGGQRATVARQPRYAARSPVTARAPRSVAESPSKIASTIRASFSSLSRGMTRAISDMFT